MSINLQTNQPQIEGNWWDPSNPTDKWHGTLVMVAGNRATIRLVEYGQSFLQSGLNKLPERRKLLHGVTKDGKAVTLSNCFSAHRTRSLGSQETDYQIQRAILGGHFLDQDLLFDEVQAEFDYLDDWIIASRFEAKDITDQEDQKEIRIRLNQEHQFPFQNADYSESLFYLGYRSQHSRFRFCVESRANLQITYREKLSLDDILKDMREWAWFLTLATGKQTHLSGLSVLRDDFRFDLGEKSFKKSYDVWIEISGKRKEMQSLDQVEMVFSLPDIQKELSKVISRWKAIQIPWAAALHRYFGSIHRDEIQLQERFLFRAQAIEAMYRAETGIIKVDQKMAYGMAWEKAPASMKIKLGEKNAFVEAVRVNRNYLTHYSPKDEARAFDFASLFDLAQKLEFLLKATILEKIGLPMPIIENAIGVHRWGRLVQFTAEA
jgi:ApeA N-terminal domain 1